MKNSVNHRIKSRSVTGWLFPISLYCVLCITSGKAETWNQLRQCCAGAVDIGDSCYRTIKSWCKIKPKVSRSELVKALDALRLAKENLRLQTNAAQFILDDAISTSTLASSKLEKAKDFLARAEQFGDLDQIRDAQQAVATAERNSEAAIKALENAESASKALEEEAKIIDDAMTMKHWDLSKCPD